MLPGACLAVRLLAALSAEACLPSGANHPRAGSALRPPAAETTQAAIEEAFREFTNREDVAVLLINQVGSSEDACCLSSAHLTGERGPLWPG